MSTTEINLRRSAITLLSVILRGKKAELKAAMDRVLEDIEASQDAESKEQQEQAEVGA